MKMYLVMYGEYPRIVTDLHLMKGVRDVIAY